MLFRLRCVMESGSRRLERLITTIQRFLLSLTKMPKGKWEKFYFSYSAKYYRELKLIILKTYTCNLYLEIISRQCTDLDGQLNDNDPNKVPLILTGTSGEITLRYDSESYPSYMDCLWTIDRPGNWKKGAL